MGVLETLNLLQDLILLDELALLMKVLYSNLEIDCFCLKTLVSRKLDSRLSALTSNPR
jgi:hypothetical protein